MNAPRKLAKAKGQCFPTAGRFILANPGWTLVHATVLGNAGPAEGIWFAHAWAERDGRAFDTEKEIEVSAERYRDAANATDVSCYSDHEAAVLMCKTEHWGPWD
jgi:hypothetical protein